MNFVQKTHIVIHHSLTKDGSVVDYEAIRRYHMETNGWKEIGYHVILEQVGGNVLAIMGRLPNEIGAHCREMHMNVYGIGICLVGNFDAAPPSDSIWKKAQQVVRYFQSLYQIPSHCVVGHREAQIMDPTVGRALKTCPGLLFDMNQFRAGL